MIGSWLRRVVALRLVTIGTVDWRNPEPLWLNNSTWKEILHLTQYQRWKSFPAFNFPGTKSHSIKHWSNFLEAFHRFLMALHKHSKVNYLFYLPLLFCINVKGYGRTVFKNADSSFKLYLARLSSIKLKIPWPEYPFSLF